MNAEDPTYPIEEPLRACWSSKINISYLILDNKNECSFVSVRIDFSHLHFSGSVTQDRFANFRNVIIGLVCSLCFVCKTAWSTRRKSVVKQSCTEFVSSSWWTLRESKSETGASLFHGCSTWIQVVARWTIRTNNPQNLSMVIMSQWKNKLIFLFGIRNWNLVISVRKLSLL